MDATLRNVMLVGKRRYYDLSGDDSSRPCEHYGMDDSINGGPNFLRNWREFRGMKQEDLAELIDTTQGMIAHLEAERRGLSAKWLRRLAPALGTTPGMLLDHDPSTLPTDIFEIWANADARQRRQLVDVAKAIVKDGTNG